MVRSVQGAVRYLEVMHKFFNVPWNWFKCRLLAVLFSEKLCGLNVVQFSFVFVEERIFDHFLLRNLTDMRLFYTSYAFLLFVRDCLRVAFNGLWGEKFVQLFDVFSRFRNQKSLVHFEVFVVLLYMIWLTSFLFFVKGFVLSCAHDACLA